MNTYRVDFTAESLRRKKGARTRLMRDVRKIIAKMKKGDEQPRYLWKRRTDGSLGYWFQLPDDVSKDVAKDKKTTEMLKAYGWAPCSPPVLPQSEWKRL